MKKIAIEEHFGTKEYMDLARQMINKTYPNKKVIEEEVHLDDASLIWIPAETKHKTKAGAVYTIEEIICDVDDKRLKIMDEEGIDVAVLSFLSPGVQIFEPEVGTAISRRINDWVSEKVKAHPDRLVSMITIAPQDPVEAAAEIERASKYLGLKGILINSHTKGEYLDDKKFWPIFEAAEKYNQPIYLHPRCPSPQMIEPYAVFPDLTGSMMGFAAETSLHALRLMLSGVFDQYPGLKIILGHLGEAIPLWMWRIDNRLRRMSDPGRIKHLPSYYFRNNFVITTSGMYWNPAFNFTHQVVGADQIFFAADFPFENFYVASEFIDQVEISPADKEKIAHINAEKLFGI